VSEFDDLIDKFRTVKIGDKEIKVRLLAKEAGRINLCLKRTMTAEDADRITEIMKSMIKRANPQLKDDDVDAIVAYNFLPLFEQTLLLCNPELTKEQLEEAKRKYLEEEKKETGR